MKVLLITGDKTFGPGHERYELMRSAVDRLEVVYFGRDSLRPVIPDGPFDVVTAQDPLWRGHFAWHLSRRLNTKLNLQVHADLRSYSAFARFWAGFNLRQAHTVRVVSETIKKQVQALGVKASITVLPVFVEVTRFERLAHEPHDGQTILWIGRFEDEKDPLLAIDVFKEVLTKHLHVKLVMLGKGTLESVLREKAVGLPIEFPGWQDSAMYLAKADVVLSTSRYESWGASIVEALAAGVPVVAPDIGIAEAAGALVTGRRELSQAITRTLVEKPSAVLKLKLSTKDEWVTQWRQSLV